MLKWKGRVQVKMNLIKLLFLFVSVTYCEADWLTKSGDHEGGFFRLGLWGAPVASSSTTLPAGEKIELGGMGSMARIQIGWSIVPRVALHVNLIDIFANNDTAGMQGFTWGPGITVYAPVGNLFVTGVYGFSLVNYDGDKNGQGNQWYIGIGKEFLLSQCNGLGVMATWGSGSWEDSDSHQKWNESGPGFQFTWTYN